MCSIQVEDPCVESHSHLYFLTPRLQVSYCNVVSWSCPDEEKQSAARNGTSATEYQYTQLSAQYLNGIVFPMDLMQESKADIHGSAPDSELVN